MVVANPVAMAATDKAVETLARQKETTAKTSSKSCSPPSKETSKEAPVGEA